MVVPTARGTGDSIYYHLVEFYDGSVGAQGVNVLNVTELYI